MERNIDGNYTLEETQSAINLTETHGNQLTSLDADPDAEQPTNIAVFEDTDDEVQTQLVQKPPGCPAGRTEVCSGTVFVSGKKKRVVAYR